VAKATLDQVWADIGTPDKEDWAFKERLAYSVEAICKFMSVPYADRVQYKSMFDAPRPLMN
jgi:hypothetical protein